MVQLPNLLGQLILHALQLPLNVNLGDLLPYLERPLRVVLVQSQEYPVPVTLGLHEVVLVDPPLVEHLVQ